MFSVNGKSHVLYHVLTPSGDKLRSFQNFAIEQNCVQKNCGQEYYVEKIRNYKAAYLWECTTMSCNTDGEIVSSQDFTMSKHRCQFSGKTKSYQIL